MAMECAISIDLVDPTNSRSTEMISSQRTETSKLEEKRKSA